MTHEVHSPSLSVEQGSQVDSVKLVSGQSATKPDIKIVHHYIR